MFTRLPVRTGQTQTASGRRSLSPFDDDDISVNPEKPPCKYGPGNRKTGREKATDLCRLRVRKQRHAAGIEIEHVVRFGTALSRSAPAVFQSDPPENARSIAVVTRFIALVAHILKPFVLIINRDASPHSPILNQNRKRFVYIFNFTV